MIKKKTISQTPAPKKDRVKGSKVNKQGSASSEKKASEIILSEKTITTLKNKLEDFKKDYPKNKNVSLNDLKAVYRRGSGAFSTSYRPFLKGGRPNSRAAWSFARVNKFLEKAAGKKVKASYIQDDDLLKSISGIKQSFDNYPEKASENASEGYILNMIKGTCKNSIGVLTAKKLIDRKNLDITQIIKIYSFLKRAKVYKGEKDKCGYISYQLWGGDEMMNWTKKIVENEK